MANQDEKMKQSDEKKSSSVFLKKGVIIPVLLMLIVVAGGIYWYVGTLGYVTTDDAFVDGNKLSISSKMLGRIVALNVAEGDSVKTGQVLVSLDSTDLIARKHQAAANLSLAKESIPLSNVHLAKAQEDFDRAEKQYKGNIIPKEQFDHAKKALEAAKAESAIAQSKINTAKAQLEVIQSELNNTTIVSPMDGVVAKRWVLKGDVIQPGQPIYTIYDTKNIWVTAEFQETDLASLHLQDTVNISVDTYPDQPFVGTIFQLPTNTASQFSLIPPDNASGNFTKVTQRAPVKISIRSR